MEAVPELELITDHFQGVKIVPIVDEGYESLPKIPDSTISDTQDDINGYAIQSNDNLAVEKFSSGLSIHSDADGAQLNYTNTKEWPTLKESRSAAFEISQISDILATNRPLVNSNSPARKYDAVSNGLDMIEDEEEPDWVEISSEALHNISKFTAAQQAERSKNIASAWNEHTTPKGADTIEVVEEEFADEFEQVPSKIPVPISKKSTWFKSAEAQIAPYFKRSTKTSKDLITKRPHSPLLIRRIIDAVKDSSRKVAPLKQVRKAISAIPEDADEEKMGNSASEILSKEAINEKLRFESDYTVLRQLGAGGHSTVKLSLRKKDGKRFVSKCINSNNVWHWEGHVPMEIHMMKLLKSKGRSVIQYVDHFEMDKDFIIIMEYLGQDWLDLYDYVENYGPVKESNTKAIFKQIVKSVDWMHSLGISHNDIKGIFSLIQTRT